MKTISESSRAHTRLPAVSWWHVIVTMERSGYTHAAMAAAIGSARTTVEGWKNRAAEPGHTDGERMIALWRVVTGKGREDLPLKDSEILSAASFK